MIKYRLFPSTSQANEDGLLAIGGDLTLDTLISAYAQGIFPWFNEGDPILWWSPDPRMVLHPRDVKVSRSLKKTLKSKFKVTCNEAFEPTLLGCALRGNNSPTESTWITQSMHEAYRELFNHGYAHSVEVWNAGELVGGLYGVVMGNVFFGESMFSKQRDTSKVGLVFLCQHLLNKGFELIDCQVESSHLKTLGARNIARTKFERYLSGIDVDQPSNNFATDFPTKFSDLTILRSLESDIKQL